MGKYTLRKNVEIYFNKNSRSCFFLLLMLIAGLTAGVLLACSTNDSDSAALSQSITEAFLSLKDKESRAIYLSLVMKNLRCVTVIFLSALCVYTLPFVYLNILAFGLSLSFVISFITFSFGKTGFVLAVLLLLTTIVIWLPIVMLLSVTAVDCTLHNMKNHKKQKKQNRKKLLIFCLIVFMLLNVVSLLDLTIISKLVKPFSACI